MNYNNFFKKIVSCTPRIAKWLYENAVKPFMQIFYDCLVAALVFTFFSEVILSLAFYIKAWLTDPLFGKDLAILAEYLIIGGDDFYIKVLKEFNPSQMEAALNHFNGCGYLDSPVEFKFHKPATWKDSTEALIECRNAVIDHQNAERIKAVKEVLKVIKRQGYYYVPWKS